MKPPTRKLPELLGVFVVLSLVVAAPATFARAEGGNFKLTKSTIDNGGGSSSGGEFTLTGTIGQADASGPTASGGGFRLSGGLWPGSIAEPPGVLFSDSFEG